MKKITDKRLEKNILAAMMGLTVAFGGLAFAPSDVEAAAASPEQIQRLNELKRQVAAAQAELIHKDQTAKKESSETGKASGTEADTEVSAPDFATRIQNILKEYETQTENPYAKLLEKHKTEKKNDIETPADTSAAHPETTNQPAPALPSQPERTYNFDWRGTPLPQSLYGVAKIAGKGIVINGEMTGSVYMSLKNVTCSQALQYLSDSFGFNWMMDGNNIVVSTDQIMKQSRTFTVDFANKDKIKEEFVALGIPSDNVYANTETGTVSVTGTPFQLAEAAKRLKSLDHPVAQCLLLAQLIEIQHGKNLDLGMSYTLPTYSHNGDDTSTDNIFKGNWSGKLSFSATSRASRELSKGHVIARPIVMALNGQKGTVNFGDSVPVLTKTDTGSTNSITVTYQDIGTKLEMTPVINRSDDITLNINLEVSNITSWQTSGDTRAPQTSKRTATTSAHLKSGQSLVIGGLMSQRDLDNLSGIPGLMNLPILGQLFSYHSKSKDYSEIYVMITPFIVSDRLDTQIMYDELSKYDAKAVKGGAALPKNDWAAKLAADSAETES